MERVAVPGGRSVARVRWRGTPGGYLPQPIRRRQRPASRHGRSPWRLRPGPRRWRSRNGRTPGETWRSPAGRRTPARCRREPDVAPAHRCRMSVARAGRAAVRRASTRRPAGGRPEHRRTRRGSSIRRAVWRAAPAHAPARRRRLPPRRRPAATRLSRGRHWPGTALRRRHARPRRTRVLPAW